MADLFIRVCVPVAKRATVGAFYQQWRVMAIDGTVIDVPDTDVNAAEFGYYAAGTAKQSAFAQVRILTLVECGTHASGCSGRGTSGPGRTRGKRRRITPPKQPTVRTRGSPNSAGWGSTSTPTGPPAPSPSAGCRSAPLTGTRQPIGS
jgi:hypothetical protein